MELNKFTRMYELACCIRSAANDIMEANGLDPIETGGVTHKGPDYECENCLSMWVWREDTLPDAQAIVKDGCSSPKERDFVLEIALPVCTEEITPCNETVEPCQPYELADGEQETPRTPCVAIEPKLGGGGCDVGERPTVAEETAYIWGLRDALETYLVGQVKCCAVECCLGRCEGINLKQVTESTEGGCSYLTFRLSILL